MKKKVPGQTTAGTDAEIKAARKELRLIQEELKEKQREFADFEGMTDLEICELYGVGTRQEAVGLLDINILSLQEQYDAAKYKLECVTEPRYPLLSDFEKV